jgi:transposase
MSRRRIKNPKKRGSGQQKESTKESTQKRQEISFEELKSIVARAKELGLEEESLSKLDAAVDTLGVLTRELEAKGASILRLRRLIFGPRTEKTSKVLGEEKKADASDKNGEAGADGASLEQVPGEAGADTETGAKETSEDAVGTQIDKPKRKGHGRRGSKEYTGAKRCKVDHETLKHGDSCPECDKGKVYRLQEPKVLVRVTGVAPIDATVYEMEGLRCNLCGEVFWAKTPDGVGEEKYDNRAAAMIALLKYGCGTPFNRLAKLEENLGIPLPASTQWELVQPAAYKMVPVLNAIIRLAAQGEILHNDDTVGRILKLEGIRNGPYVIDDDGIDQKRTGIFTSGIVSIIGGYRIALFFTSRKHAGENLETVLKLRAEGLGPPIQMSDGLNRNTKGEVETIETECNCHSRRKYVEVVKSFPDEVEYVLNQYQIVYKNDDKTKELGMSDDERLAYHQEHSGPIMEGLEKYLRSALDEHKVEPNSSLGDAIRYTLDHWIKLTMFLKIPGAPLDNNICERAMKKAILHRKNAYFFRTKNGAFVGDLFMTLIHTTELNDENPFEYLVALLDNADRLAQEPERWMPWNFRETLATLESNKNL